jgi:signal transduction histidine kinase/HD-like signal output (HDOD) protein
MCSNDANLVDRELAQRAELLLYQLDSLPTLDRIAVRAMDLAASDHAGLDDLVAMARLDPGLACRLITHARCAIPSTVPLTTIEAAARRLGLTAARSAVLSVPLATADRRDDSAFRVDAWWRHAVVVARTCEILARDPALTSAGIDPDEAYLAGLVHDVGLLAMHTVLPDRLEAACALVESGDIALDLACQRVFGLTTRTVGRKLAEHWRLPHLLVDVLWLHGQPSVSLPDLPHRPLIELVGLAACVASEQAPTPNRLRRSHEELADLALSLGIGLSEVEIAVTEAIEQVEQSSLHEPCTPESVLRSVVHANQTLGRMHAEDHPRRQRAGLRARTLHAITAFHDDSATGGSFVSMFGKVVRSAGQIFGPGFYAMLFQARVSEPWHFMQFAADGRLLRSEVIVPPAGSTAVGDLADPVQVSMQALAMLPWITDYVGDARDVRDVRLLPLRCGWGVNAILLHDVGIDGVTDRTQIEALSRTWAAALAAAAHHAGARNLGEKLAESNRALLTTRDALSRRHHLASLGEIAAGAAHEMNNPLTVISGRAQLLASRLEDPGHLAMAEQIVEQSHRLSGMISSLRSFAEPTRPQRRPVDLKELLDEQVQRLYREHGDGVCAKVIVSPGLPDVSVDPELFGRAVIELLRNAAESEGSRDIELRVQIEHLDDRLLLQIVDDGMGLTRHAQAHAFDPFFSAKSAGRQPGLGLAHARRIIEAHGGRIMLENGTTRGAVAIIRMAGWRADGEARHAA